MLPDPLYISGLQDRWGKAAVSVVDGQHRFLGITYHWERNPDWLPNVPVVLNFGMTFEEEAEFFDVINSTQRKLPKALIEITKADVTEAGVLDHAQRVRLIATSLARHPKSVWQGKVNLTGARDPNKPVTFESNSASTPQIARNGWSRPWGSGSPVGDQVVGHVPCAARTALRS